MFTHEKSTLLTGCSLRSISDFASCKHAVLIMIVSSLRRTQVGTKIILHGNSLHRKHFPNHLRRPGRLYCLFATPLTARPESANFELPQSMDFKHDLEPVTLSHWSTCKNALSWSTEDLAVAAGKVVHVLTPHGTLDP